MGKLPEEEVTQGREWRQVIWAQDRVLASGFQVEPGCPKAPPVVSGAARVRAKTLSRHPGKDKGPDERVAEN